MSTTSPPTTTAAPPPALFHPTVARLTYRTLLGSRRALILFALPALLLVIAVAVRTLSGADDTTTKEILGGFALATLVPLLGVIAGTGAIGPEIDDGSVIYLLAKPVRRSTIVLTKLTVATGVTLVFSALPVLLAGFILNGNSQHLAVAYATAAAIASLAYAALFLLLGTITRHAVVIGLVYALVWETFFGNLVPGARPLSIQQWALALGARLAPDSAVTSDVTLPTAAILLIAVTTAATWYATHRLRSLTLAGDE
ncbi:ABC transporter permease [Streptomyces sp. NPDC002067]